MPPSADTNAQTGVALTLDDVAERLEKSRSNRTYVLSPATAPEIGDLLGALGAPQLAIVCPDAPAQTAEQLTIVGTSSLYGVPDVEAHARFTVVDGALSAALHAVFGAGHRLDVAGLGWASVGDLTLDMSVVGPSLEVPVVASAVSGTIRLKSVKDPITVTLVQALGSEWILRATDIPLPDLAALEGLAKPGAAVPVPPKVADVGGFEIVELACRFDPDAWAARSVAITVGAPGKTWDFAPELPGLPKLREVSLLVGAEFPTTGDEDGEPALNGDVAVNVRAAATITLGTEVSVPVEVTRDGDEWRVGIVGAHGFPKLGDLVAEVAGKDATDVLPDVLAELRMTSATLELTIGSDGVRSVLFGTRLADRWPIVTGHLELDGVEMQLFHDLGADGTSGFFSATIGIEHGALEIPVAVRRPGPTDPITIELGTSAPPQLPKGMASLPGLSGGGHIAATLPTGLGEVAFVLHDLSLTIDPSAPAKVTGKVSGEVDLPDVTFAVSAAKPTADGPWELKGAVLPPAGAETIALGKLIDALAKAVGHLELPAPLAHATLSRAEVTFKTSGSFSIECDVQFPVDGRDLDLDLKVQVDRANGAFTAEFSGTTKIGGLGFTLAFSKDATETRFLAAYGHDEAPRPIDLADLLEVVSPSLAKDVDLSVDLREVVLAIAADTGSTRAVFALELGEFDLSHLPLVGSQLRDAATIKDLQVVAAPAAPGTGDVAAWNGLLAQAGLKSAKPLPATIGAGVSVSAVMSLGEQVAPISLPAAAPAKPADGTAVAAPPADGTKWFPVKRSFGPVQLDRVGARYDAGRVWVVLDGSLSLGGLSFTLMGLSVGSPLTEFVPEFHLDGVGLAFAEGGLEIAGAFLAVPKQDLGDALFKYDGAAVVRAESFALAAVGSYAALRGSDGAAVPSLMVFAELDAPLGGPPAFYVTGLMGGFGYNRSLRIPGQDEVFQFPFVQGLAGGGGKTKDATPLGMLDVLEGRGSPPARRWLDDEIGEYWLAAGLTFTSFELVETHALLIAEFGRELQFALIGLSKMRLPQDPTAAAFAYIELELEAVLKPDDGFFGLTARLSPNAFVIAPACRLTGGFAFYLWFGGDHAGDFVVTLGGYHPSFKRPDWYPEEPRLGLSWPIDRLVSVDGQAYFALTPSCVMGGGALHLLFHDGNLQAWLTASADFLIGWKPFRYNADIGVSVGVSYRIDWVFLKKTLKAEIGAHVSLWGPPTGGRAEVSWYFISFTVGFGAGPPVPQTLHKWAEFAPLLPGADDLCKVTVQSGLLPGGAKDEWIVRADTLELASECAIPASALKLSTRPDDRPFLTPKQAPAIRPLGLAAVESTHTLRLTNPFGHEIDPDKDEWTIKERTRSVPEALWGAPLGDAKPAPAAGLVKDQLVGFTISPPDTVLGPTRGAVDMNAALADVELEPGGRLPGAPQAPAPGAPDDDKAATAVAGIAGHGTVNARGEIRAVLASLGLDPGTDDALDAFVTAEVPAHTAPPMLAVAS